jgi:hypothetical protein
MRLFNIASPIGERHMLAVQTTNMLGIFFTSNYNLGIVSPV